MIVFTQHLIRRLALRVSKLNGNQFCLKTSFFIGCLSTTLRAQGELILHLSRDALLFTIKLSGVRHIESAITVKQRNHQRIFKLSSRSQAKAIAPANREGSLRHGFHASGDHSAGLAELDHLRGIDDGLHA